MDPVERSVVLAACCGAVADADRLSGVCAGGAGGIGRRGAARCEADLPRLQA